MTGVDDLHRTRTLCVETHEEARDLVERSLRRGEPDALQRTPRELLETLERQREMRAALGRDHRVDLVDDHGLHVAEAFARRARQHEVQGLGRRDEDVRRRLRETRAVLRRRVAGPDRDARLTERRAETLRGVTDPDERTAQVSLDVDRERLQRRDVDDAAARRIGMEQLVDRGEERGERLARAGRREDERALTRRDRRPRELLRARGRRERALEPFACGLVEGREGAAPHRERVLARAAESRREDVGCIARNSEPARTDVDARQRNESARRPAGVRGHNAASGIDHEVVPAGSNRSRQRTPSTSRRRALTRRKVRLGSRSGPRQRTPSSWPGSPRCCRRGGAPVARRGHEERVEKEERRRGYRRRDRRNMPTSRRLDRCAVEVKDHEWRLARTVDPRRGGIGSVARQREDQLTPMIRARRGQRLGRPAPVCGHRLPIAIDHDELGRRIRCIADQARRHRHDLAYLRDLARPEPRRC